MNTAAIIVPTDIRALVKEIETVYKANIDWGDGTPATFHEQRSLAERLYKEQGINTRKLLGHKSQRQTDRYNDDRGKDWITIAV